MREKIEQNFGLSIAGIVLATGIVVAGATWAIVGFVYSSAKELLIEKQKVDTARKEGTIEYYKRELALREAKHRRELDKQKSINASIERRLGGQPYLDISTLLTGPKDPDGIARDYFPDGNYFALSDESRWTHRKIHEGELHEEIRGIPKEQLFSPQALKTMEKFNTRVWKGKIDYNIEGFTFARKLFPYVMVQIIPLQVISEFFPAHFTGRKTETLEVEKDDFTREYLAGLEVAIHSDAVGAFFVKKVSGIMRASIEDRTFTFRLTNVQKKGPVLYAQMIFILNEVKIEGVRYDRYFIVNEWIIVARKNDLLNIEVVSSTSTPHFAGGYFEESTRWLTAFHLAEY